MGIRYRRQPTKQMIIQTGTKLYLEHGFTNTSNSMICKALDISNGQLTFHFPTKEHLLAVLVEELCDFQWKIINDAPEKGESPLLAICLELAAMASICRENKIAKDFYLSSYTLPMTFKIISNNDVERAKTVVGRFCTDWTHEQFKRINDIVLGIEMITLMNADDDSDSLENRISAALNSILLLYQVPESFRKMKIQKVLNMDYTALGHRILKEFAVYVDTINSNNLEEVILTKYYNT